MRMDTREFYLRSPEEMAKVFADQADAVTRSQEIADSVELELDLGHRHFPVYTPPEGKKSEGFLRGALPGRPQGPLQEPPPTAMPTENYPTKSCSGSTASLG